MRKSEDQYMKDNQQKTKIDWGKEWPALVLAIPLLVFCLLMPYFKLYELLIPVGLHEWAGEHFKAFFRGLERYSMNPMRDKVMFTWATFLGFVWGLFYVPIFAWDGRNFNAEAAKKRIIGGIMLGFWTLVIICYIWLMMHKRSSGKDFIYGAPISYLFCSLFASAVIIGFITAFIEAGLLYRRKE